MPNLKSSVPRLYQFWPTLTMLIVVGGVRVEKEKISAEGCVWSC